MEGWTAPEHPYPKMAERLGGRALPGGTWVAEEKVHGANLAIRSDGEVSRAASRRRELDEDALDGFFGLTRLWPELAAAAAALARDLAGERPGFRSVVVYGELAGGAYPHPDVPPVPGVAPVQTGVWYGPDVFWLVFDALVRTESSEVWLGRAALESAAARCGLRCVPVLGRGTRAEVARLPAEFPTRVPGMSRAPLPVLPGNPAEGLVLKSAVTWDVRERGPRPVQKIKTRAFAEDERYAGARPFRAPRDGVAGVPAWLVAAAVDRLVPPRVAAARGKLGRSAGTDSVAAEVLADALGDLAAAVGGLGDAERRLLERALVAGVRVLVEGCG